MNAIRQNKQYRDFMRLWRIIPLMVHVLDPHETVSDIPSNFRFLETGESTKSRTQPHEFPMMAMIGMSPVPLAVWTVTTKEYQVKLLEETYTDIIHTWMSWLVCSFWFWIRQCRNCTVDNPNSNVVPPFKHAGISMRLAWDHGCSQTPATGFDSGTESVPSRPKLSPVPLWSVSLTWLLEHRAGHLSHMGFFGPGSTDRLP